ncbi:MAG: hypothetical protein BZY88_10510 [SAR202 cluster bacterium Io17-Chloro-G9]|nr:MAG: hypothetical protein BZY88_10510 [SAR202 cluster bacterium Io17-Chloro-G9]
MFFLLGIGISVALVVICVAVAMSKGRNPWFWGVLGFFFGFITLIIIAALPSRRPEQHNAAMGVVGGTRRCHQCDAENIWESVFCTNCGARLESRPEVGPVKVAPARLLTPIVGLIVGLLFALVLLQSTKLSAETMVESVLGEGATLQDVERLQESLEEMPSVVLFWPVSPGLHSFVSNHSPTSLVWQLFPATLEVMILGGGLAVLLAWGLALGLRRRHPGITAGRMSVAGLAAVPAFWLGFITILVLVRYFDWLPPLGYADFWEDLGENLRQLVWPIFALGIMGGFWISLEMPSRKDDSAMLVLARVLGLALRHSGMLLSGVILLEIIFVVPGLGRILLASAFQRDPAVLGAAAAVMIWFVLLSRFLGNMLLAAVDGEAPARGEGIRGEEGIGRQESGAVLAIGGGVTLVLLILLLLAPIVSSQDPHVVSAADGLAEPGGGHWLGTDRLGRDIFSRVLHGGRTAAQVGLPMGILAIFIGFPMAVTRTVVDRARFPALAYAIEGVLEGLVAVPWLVAGILIQVNVGAGWPFLALMVILVPRALRVGWALGAGERLQSVNMIAVALRLGALFLAASVAISAALGFVGFGLPPDRVDLGQMLGRGGELIAAAPWVVIFPGLFLSLIAATWLVVAALFSRKGPDYEPVGWTHIMS